MSVEVIGAGGVRLAVQTHGDPGAPTLVCVHGYPDDHSVWDGVVAQLAERFHVVTYDVRGAGASDTPTGRAAYRVDLLEEDLAAVVDAVSPDRPVHLLGHDWGSIQSWHAVTGERLEGRIASFTSISGPCLDHVGQAVRLLLCRPTVAGTRYVLRQVVLSFYIALFQLPLLPELAWRSGFVWWVLRGLLRLTGDERTRPELSNTLSGLNLYRANVLRRVCAPGERRAHIPVQVLVPERDAFVAPPVAEQVEWWAPSARIVTVPGGHWAPATHPAAIAARVREFVADFVEV